MIDVNTIIGEAVETQDGGIIIPVSRVSLGFAAGGAEYQGGKTPVASDSSQGAGLPFGGGSGAGVSVQPVGFLVIHEGDVRILPVNSSNVLDRLIDTTPQLIDQVAELMGKGGSQNDRQKVTSGSRSYYDDEHDDGYAR